MLLENYSGLTDSEAKKFIDDIPLTGEKIRSMFVQINREKKIKLLSPIIYWALSDRTKEEIYNQIIAYLDDTALKCTYASLLLTDGEAACEELFTNKEK